MIELNANTGRIRCTGCQADVGLSELFAETAKASDELSERMGSLHRLIVVEQFRRRHASCGHQTSIFEKLRGGSHASRTAEEE